MKYYILIISFLFTRLSLFCQLPSLVIYDNNQSHQFGANNLLTAHKIIYQNLNEIIPTKLWDESNLFKKAGGISYRALRLGATGFQIDVNTVLIQHEVFGHGSRMREFEYSNIKYTFNHIFPFNFGGTAGGRSSFPNSPTQRILVSSGGVEGDLILSEKLEESVLITEKLHYRQSSLFLVSRNNLLRYSRRDIRNFGDISSYVNQINSKYSTTQNEISVRNIFNQALVTLLNPLQLYALLNLSKDYLIDASLTPMKLPFIKIKKVNYLPSLNFNLTPFGGEFIFNNHFVKNEKLLLLRARFSDSRFANFYGGTIKYLNWINTESIKLNASIDLWNQPSYSIGSPNELEQINEGFGFMTKSSVNYFPVSKFHKIGIHGEIGYKTNGYVMGEKLGQGLILRVGIAIKLNESSEGE